MLQSLTLVRASVSCCRASLWFELLFHVAEPHSGSSFCFMLQSLTLVRAYVSCCRASLWFELLFHVAEPHSGSSLCFMLQSLTLVCLSVLVEQLKTLCQSHLALPVLAMEDLLASHLIKSAPLKSLIHLR